MKLLPLCITSLLAGAVALSAAGITVADDGDASYFDSEPPSGYGLVGMSERASLHGGTLEAGPNQGRGWTVKAVLPKQGWQA